MLHLYYNRLSFVLKQKKEAKKKVGRRGVRGGCRLPGLGHGYGILMLVS